VHRFDIGPALTAQIARLARTHEATLFITLFAAFAVLLRRMSGQDDLLVGIPIAGRKGAEVENPHRLLREHACPAAQVDPRLSFLDLLSNLKTTMIDAFEHQDMPFEKLVLELNPKRDLSHSPLIQVMFSLQNIPPLQKVIADGAGGDPGMAQNLEGHTGTAKFDLALFVSEVADSLQCAIEFNTDLFSPATAKTIGDYYVRLLEGVGPRPAGSPRITFADERRHPKTLSRERRWPDDGTRVDARMPPSVRSPMQSDTAGDRDCAPARRPLRVDHIRGAE